jgi:hypothetical protein
LKIVNLVLFFIISFVQIGYSQYAAPKLKCVQKGTNSIDLTWQTVVESCGAFQNYEIHYAPTKAGPFSVLVIF